LVWTSIAGIDIDPGAGVDPWGVNPFNPCAPDVGSRTYED